MKYFDWDPEKNELLIQSRGVSFEQILVAMNSGDLLKIVKYPNRIRYPNQQLLYILIENYVYVVPFVENEEKLFLKTIIPSRKATKEYRANRKEN